VVALSRTIDVFGHHTPVWEVVAGGAAVVVGLVVLALLARTLKAWNATLGVKLAAVFALMATAVSMNTNWRFFGGELGITNVAERAGLFAVVEGAMLTFAVQARENKLSSDNGSPGTQGTLLWVMSGLAMLPAWIEAGAVAGTVRALIGPFLAALLWHYALGLELARVKPQVAKDGLVAALVARARESLLATLGAAQPDQSALEIRQGRALNKAARLADRLDTMERNWFGRRTRVRNRLRKAVRLSGAGTDPARRRELVELMHTTRTADQISRVTMASPWALAAAQIEAEQSAATLALESAPAVAELESAPIQESEGAPRIDKSTFGALVGALAEAVSAQIAAPNQASAHNGAPATQNGHSSAQPAAPSAAPNVAPVPEPWFEVPAVGDGFDGEQGVTEPVFALDGASAAVRFTAPLMDHQLPVSEPETAPELATEPEQGQDEETEQNSEEKTEESLEDEPKGRRGRGGRRGLFEALDTLVAAGDLRVFDDATRNEVAYQVNENLPSEPPIAKGTVRRYALDYVKVHALYRGLDERVTAGDLRVFDGATRDAAVAEVLAEVNATYNGGALAPRLVADSVAEYVATLGSRLGADLGAPVTDAAAPEPSPGGEYVMLPRQIAPGGDPVAVDGWASAQ
jgi:hypothetical protein